jgi:hypothetical protein
MKTHKLSIAKLKGVRDLQEITLDHKPVTGIFGPNGVGKSTILHALAAAYAPPGNGRLHEFKDFFPKLTNDVWDGSHFTIEHEIRTSASQGIETTIYRKGAVTTRWTPTCSNRPTREVHYMGLRSVVPSLERHSNHNLASTTTSPITDNITTDVLAAASIVMNIGYNSLAEVGCLAHPRRQYRAVGRSDQNGSLMIDVTLGAGEQRLLELLRTVHTAKHYSLILVDEIDLLLHGVALKRLFQHLHDHCRTTHKQLIFTSHREEILKWEDCVSVHHLNRVAGSHVCLPNTDPDAVCRLTGNREKPLEFFVEDILAETIVNRVASDLQMQRLIKVVKYGAISNCYTVCTGLLLAGQDCSHSLFVQDGDEYRTADQKRVMIGRCCTGGGPTIQETKARALELITDFALPANTSPERFLHRLVSEVDHTHLAHDEVEVQRLAAEVVIPGNTHDYLNSIAQALGGELMVQLDHLVRIASKHPEWPAYTAPIRDWLTHKKSELGL